jgi:hypothetical protein
VLHWRHWQKWRRSMVEWRGVDCFSGWLATGSRPYRSGSASHKQRQNRGVDGFAPGLFFGWGDGMERILERRVFLLEDAADLMTIGDPHF